MNEAARVLAHPDEESRTRWDPQEQAHNRIREIAALSGEALRRAERADWAKALEILRGIRFLAREARETMRRRP